VEPFAISRDSPYTHVALMQALDLDFPLLSDWNAEATRGFGVAYEHNGM
jgi:peroxiredoxin